MSEDTDMRVTKRDGELEDIAFDKILTRVKKLGQEANIQINYSALVMKVIDQLYDKIPTTKIDELTAEQCAVMSTQHPDYAVLAGRVVVSNHQKNTESSFFSVVEKLYWHNDIHGNHSPLLSHDMWLTVNQNREELEEMIDYNRDYLIDYFGFKTLERAYLFKVDDVVVERPQHMWLRVAIGIHGYNMDAVKETYDLMSQKYFTHATPTLFNAGTPRPQLSSCYLIAMEDDSVDGIYDTLKDCAKISKWAGGIGLHIHNIRAKGTRIRGTNGKSNGIVPMLRVFNNTAKYIDQCVHPETIIYTKRGPIKIKNIVIGDKVITDDGYFYKIGKILDYDYTGDFYSLDIKHTLYPLELTDMHPLWTIKNNVFYQRNFDKVINQLDRNLLVADYVEVKNIKTNDFVGFPIPKYEKDIIQYTEDDCRFYGILLGDGNISVNRNTAYVALNKDTKRETIDFVEQYLNKININIGYTYQNDKYVRLTWTRNNMFKFTYEMLYDDNKEKYVMPSMLHLPKNKILNLIKGILETDGKVKDYQVVLETTSNSIVESLRYMLLRLGILTSGTSRDRRNESHTTKYGSYIQNKKISYILIIPKKEIICDLFKSKNLTPSKTFTFFEYDDYLFSIVKKNTFIQNYSGRVIDIEVDDDDHHNFLTHNGLVKNGGGRRNGSFAIYLETWHADIEDFLDMRKNHGDEELRARDLFYALWVSDLFMERVKENGKWSLFCPHECPGLADVYGDKFKELYMKYEESGNSSKIVNARDLWFKVLDAQMETGTPYLLYKDAANNKSNQKNIGTIKSSNLCVAPETQILTDTGYYEIQSLHNQSVNVWNGEEFSEVTIHKTGENQELVDVYTSDGCKLSCTKYHKFYIQTKYNKSSKSKTNNNIIVVEAQNLKEGDKIIKCEFPIIDNEKEMKYAYTHGFFCGDGTYNNNVESEQHHRCNFKSLVGHSYCKRHIDFENEKNTNDIQTDTTNYICNATSNLKKPTVSLYGEKIDLLKYLNYRSCGEVDDKLKKLNVQLPLDIEEKFTVPQNFSLKTKLEWFSGLCDADGTISKNGDNQQLQISSIEEEFLLNVKFMLQTCGINPKVTKMCGESKKLLPDSNRNLKLYDCKSVYRLLVTSNDLQKIVKLGFEPKRLKVNEHTPNRNANQFIKIVSVSDKGRIDDTYCFNEPKKHSGIFNGIITSQCTEIMEYSDDKETAVCNLASIALPAFVNEETKEFDYDKLHKVAKVVTGNLNRIIDVNFYPTIKTERSNLLHRPIGIGVQGLADTFIMMDIPFHSEQAKEVNKLIFETIYHAALERSNEIAISRKDNVHKIRSNISENDLFNMRYEYNIQNEVCYDLIKNDISVSKNDKVIIAELINITNDDLSGSYSSFDGSPASQGILQFDLWGVQPTPNRYDWDSLKELIKKYGLRNSLLIAPMPTASTSQILGYNECFEPLTSNLYTRRTLAGEFVVANKYLMKDLIALGLWNEKIKNNIIANKGSVQQLTVLPQHIRDKYKIVWEMPMKHLIDMSADRGAFICQSQSLNLWLEDPNYNTLTSMHFYSWKMGLKTGIYYLRRKAKHQAQQFTVEPEKRNNHEDNDEICEMCSG